MIYNIKIGSFSVKGMLKWLIGPLGGIIIGIEGNASYEMIKARAQNLYFQEFYKSEIAASHEGYIALVDADNANKAGDRERAKSQYEYAIERLNYAANGGIARSMAILHDLYCVGREGYVEANPALGRRWGATAASKGDKFGSNQCPQYNLH